VLLRLSAFICVNLRLNLHDFAPAPSPLLRRWCPCAGIGFGDWSRSSAASKSQVSMSAF
jgi:hypothetical protein